MHTVTLALNHKRLSPVGLKCRLFLENIKILSVLYTHLKVTL